MLTVIETPLFQRYAAAVGTDEQREDFVRWIAVNRGGGRSNPRRWWFAQSALVARGNGQAWQRPSDLFHALGAR